MANLKSEKGSSQTVVLDVSQGIAFGFFYRPFVGKGNSKKTFPMIDRFTSWRPKKVKKLL